MKLALQPRPRSENVAKAMPFGMCDQVLAFCGVLPKLQHLAVRPTADKTRGQGDKDSGEILVKSTGSIDPEVELQILAHLLEDRPDDLLVTDIGLELADVHW